MTEDRRKAVIYARISMDRTGDGAPLERQIESCQGQALAHGLEVVEVIAETQSAYEKKVRPKWNRVIEMIRGGEVQVVLAHKLDRIHRRPREMLDLIDLVKETGVSVISLDGELSEHNEAGRMLAGLMAFVAEMEIERKSARQKDKNRQSAAKGKFWHGGFRAFGFNSDGTHVPAEAEAIRLAAADVLQGVSLKEVARRWESAGLRSGRDGSTWRLQSVRAVLLNPKNAALRAYNGEIVGPGEWEPIISETTHAELKAYLTDPARRVGGNPGGRTPQNLLSGIATCSVCDEVVRAGSSRNVKVYTCGRGCVSVARAEVDALILEKVAQVFRAFGPKAVFRSGEPGEDHAGSVDPDERSNLIRRRETLTAAFVRGALDSDDYDRHLAELNRMIDEAEQQYAAEQVGPFANIYEGGPKLAEDFLARSLLGQRDMLRASAEIALKPKGRGRRNVPIEDQADVYVSLLGEQIDAMKFEG